jgi:hypothetical protein
LQRADVAHLFEGHEERSIWLDLGLLAELPRDAHGEPRVCMNERSVVCDAPGGIEKAPLHGEIGGPGYGR